MGRGRVLFVGLISLAVTGVLLLGIALTSSKGPLTRLLAGNRIGVVEIRGTIDEAQHTLKSIKSFREDTSVKAILLRINSPGGGVGPSQELYQEIRRTSHSKPVVASLGGVAASGGYYVASAANRIVANPGTLTGSIGVILSFQNLKGLFEKVGYATVTIKSGQFKDVGNPGREMTPAEKALLQEAIDGIHTQFVRDVAKGRNLPEAKVREIADGRILTGEMAKNLGLVDELGNFEDGVKAAAALAKIDKKPKLVYARKKSTSLADLLFGAETMDRVRTYLDGAMSGVRLESAFSVSSEQ